MEKNAFANLIAALTNPMPGRLITFLWVGAPGTKRFSIAKVLCPLGLTGVIVLDGVEAQ
jgi:hypothetical protein